MEKEFEIKISEKNDKESRITLGFEALAKPGPLAIICRLLVDCC